MWEQRVTWGVLCLGVLLASARANELDMAALGKPPTTAWPTFNGDYSGERFSSLRQINDSNVASLQLQWTYRIADVGVQRGAPVPVIKSTPLLVNGILYFTIPNNVYAVDARTGVKLWSFSWVDQGGHLVGNRGLGMYKSWLYFLGPDDWIPTPARSVGAGRLPMRGSNISPRRRRSSSKIMCSWGLVAMRWTSAVSW
jgi:alcohol dehydrogenase (cytochrome c)